MKSIREYIISESVKDEIVFDIENIINEIKKKKSYKPIETERVVRKLLEGMDSTYEISDQSDLEASVKSKFVSDIEFLVGIRYIERKLQKKTISLINASFDHHVDKDKNIYCEFMQIHNDPYIIIYKGEKR